MEHTSNYWKTVFLDLKHENKEHPTLVFVVLALVSIPLGHAYSSIAVAVLAGVTLITFKKQNAGFEKSLLLPIALFALMALSLVWTSDFSASLKALQKGIPLFLIPLCFMLFPKFTSEQRQRILRYFSFGISLFTMFWFIKAAFRFVITKDIAVFFYHELVTEDVNAIHVSVYVAVAVFYFLTKSCKSNLDKIAVTLMAIFLVLLSSKNILIIFMVLVGYYYFRYQRSTRKTNLMKWGFFALLLLALALLGKIKDRFLIELHSNTIENSINAEVGTESEKVYNVSIKQAWTQEQFQENDYFPGAAFRIYQARIFKEMLWEDPILFRGYGLNAVDFKIKEKAIEHHVFLGNEQYDGYQNKNFHNEYIQIFAELGIFGLLILLAILILNIKKALKTKDFIHISFAILMISLFLTESFLSRQRGIVFFTIIYCLFNSRSSVIVLKKE